MPTIERTVVVPYLEPPGDLSPIASATTWAEFLARRRGRGASVRAGSVRPSALGPVLIGDHRPAEGDRPGPRRDPARAPEEAPPAPGRAGGRPRLLVHDHRLDDVELPRRGAADARLDRPLRRQPRPPGHGRALGPGRADRDELLRHQRQLRGRLHEGRGRAIREPRPGAPRRRRLYRLAALARGLRVGLRARGPRHLAVLDQRRNRRLHRVRGRRPAAARLPRGAPGALAGRRGGGVRRAGKLGRRRGRGARDHRADALDAAVLVGGRGRLALPRQLLRPFPRRLAARRLDRDHLARHGGDLRPLRLDHQPPGRADGDQRDLPGGAGGARGARRPRRGRPAPRDRRVDAAVRRPRAGRGARRAAHGPRSSAGSASNARPATCPTPSFRFARCRGR